MGCGASIPVIIAKKIDEVLLPTNIVRLTMNSDIELVNECKKVAAASFAGDTTHAPEGILSWAYSSSESIDNNPCNPLKEAPSEERMKYFQWLMDFLFGIYLPYNNIYALIDSSNTDVEKKKVLGITILIPPNTSNLHNGTFCGIMSTVMKIGDPPKSMTNKRFKALESILKKMHKIHMKNNLHWYCNVLAVSNDQQGKGIGSQLLNFMSKLAEQTGNHAIYLETSGEKNENFYKNKGKYEVLGEKVVIDSGEDKFDYNGGMICMIKYAPNTIIKS